jgi:PII-like signaling protein
MQTQTVTLVRLYLTEAEQQLKPLLRYLHEDSHVSGVTVFRAVSGFGLSGKIHESHLLDLSLDLPLVVEFFDRPDKIQTLLPQLKQYVKPNHMLYWTAQQS